MLARSFVFALLAIVATSVQAADEAPRGIRWHTDLEQARRLAAESNRLVLIHFWADWCQPCKRLDAEVYNQPSVAQAMAAHYVPVRLNADQFKSMAVRCGIDSLPTDVVQTPDGRIVDRFNSPLTAALYVKKITEVAQAQADQTRSRRGPPSPPQAGAAPNPRQAEQAPPERPRYNPAPSRSRYPDQNRYPDQSQYPAPEQQRYAERQSPAPNGSQQYAPPADHGQRGYAPQAGGPGDLPAGEYRNPYVSEQPGPAEPQGPPAGYGRPYPPEAPRYGDRHGSADSAPAAPPEHQGHHNPPASDPGAYPPQQQAHAGYENRAGYGNQALDPREPQPGYAPHQPPMQPPRDQPVHSPPPGGPRFCLDGYCPVTLVEGKQWVEGDRRWGAVHLGQTYLFKGEAEQKAFLQNPDRYAPVLGGNDPIAAIDGNRPVPGHRRHGLYYRDHVYLFADEASLARFSQNPNRYLEGIRQAMQRQAHGRVVR